MTISRLCSAFALVVALSIPLALGAAEGHDAGAGPVINSVCPMDGKPIDVNKSPTVPMTIGEGSDAMKCRMAMCSDECCTEFKKDPAAALKPHFGKDAPGPKTNFKK